MRVDSGLALDGENGEALESLDGSARGGREKKRKMQRELRTERLGRWDCKESGIGGNQETKLRL